MVERHHAILRQAVLKTRAFAHEEGLTFDAQLFLTGAVTAKNCLTTVGHYTPQAGHTWLSGSFIA
eukprot:12005113-Prorocentrum_lima.AAC.1